MRKSLGNNIQRFLALLVMLTVIGSVSSAADFPTDLIKKIVKGSSTQARKDASDNSGQSQPETDESDAEAAQGAETVKPAIDYMQNVGTVYLVCSEDGTLRSSRCFVVANGVVAVPLTALGGKIKEAEVIFGGASFPVTDYYLDKASGLALLFTASEVSPVGSFAYGTFPDPGKKVRVSNASPQLGVIRQHDSPTAILRPVKLLGDNDRYDFVCYGVVDKDQNLIGIVVDCERVVYDDFKTSICNVVPGGYISRILQESDENKTPIKPLGKKSQLAKMTPVELKLFFDAGDMIANHDYDAALKNLRRLVRTKPIDSFAYKMLGDMYYNQGDFKKATQFYRKAIDRQPGLIGCYPLLANSLGRLGKNPEALAMLDKYSVNATSKELRDMFGRTYTDIALKLVRSRDFTSALHALRKAEEFAPGDSDVAFALGEALLNKGPEYYPEAINAYNRYIALAGPAWNEFTMRSPMTGDVVTDPRVLKARRRIANLKNKLRIQKND